MHRRARILRPLVAFAASGCITSTSEITGTGPDPTTFEPVPLSITRELDVLFVVDDSGSMRQEQAALASGFDRFTERLQDAEGRLPGLHIGVASSNVGTGPEGGGGEQCAGQGDDGVLRVPEACPVLTDGSRFIRDVAGSSDGREVNYSGTLAEQFGCMAHLGTAGCGFEQHFESMKRALSGQELNGDFLRPEASLAVLFVADEDDCSANDRSLFDPTQDDRDMPLGELSSFRCFEFGVECAPVDGGERQVGPRTDCVPEEGSRYLASVSSYVEFLRGLKADPDRVFVSSITGDPGPVAVMEDPERDPTELMVAPTCTICPGGAASGCATPDALVSAAPAIRMQALVDAFGAAGHRQDICSYDPATDSLDFGAALAGVAEKLAPRISTSCLSTTPVDTDAAASGNQAACELVEIADGAELAIPACDAGAGVLPCFRLRDNPDECPATGLALAIDRGGAPPAAGAVLSLRCALPPGP
jgi:hypothetical protein